ncbi:Uncharacterised protein [Mycobacteroides abscessus subsp. abscessus]|nr:Uncharacterised protein [Mycobacteroides abscessus subsp. abscessus]
MYARHSGDDRNLSMCRARSSETSSQRLRKAMTSSTSRCSSCSIRAASWRTLIRPARARPMA